MQSKSAKRYMIFGIVFGCMAILSFCLYYFNVIKSFGKFMAATYVIYFLGLAMIYNGSFSGENNHKFTKNLFYLLGFLALAASVAMLIYGYIKGEITFFN